MPNDLKNLFITHLVFLVPIILELYPYISISINKLQRFIVLLALCPTIVVCLFLIMGIFGMIGYEEGNIVMSENYLLRLPIDFKLESFVLYCTIIYVFAFFVTIMFSHLKFFAGESQVEPVS